MLRRISCLLLMLSTLFAGISLPQTSNKFSASQNKNKVDERDADRAEIRKHVEGIFQAFVDKNSDKLRATHSTDWAGYSMDSRSWRQGIDAYMQGAENSLKNYGMAGFKLTSFDVVFHGDIALVFYIADVELKNANEAGTDKMRALDIYKKQSGGWIQVASHLARHPDEQQKRLSTPVKVGEQTKKFILDAREQVWRAWFSNDRAKLEGMIPDEAIAIETGNPNWENRAAILEGAKSFAESGSKLVRLEFPRTEIQIYGNAIILYTSYLFETEKDGKKQTTIGSGMETFVQRDGKLINTGWLLAHNK